MKKIFLMLLVVVVIVAVIFPVYFYFMGKQSQKMMNEGLNGGHLRICPSRPSCVSSTDKRKLHAIAPLSFKPNAIATLKEITQQMRGAKVMQQSNDYLHVTFASELFKFIDDVEFLMTAGQIEVRSVSRVGYSDLDVNRKRIENIRAQYEE